jgi:hypothetical protein
MDLLQNIDETAIIENSKKKRGRPLKYSQNYAPISSEHQSVSSQQPEIITSLRITKNEIDEINLNGSISKLDISVNQSLNNEETNNDTINNTINNDEEDDEENIFSISQTNDYTNNNKKKINAQKIMKENAELKEQLKKKSNTFQTSIINYNVGFTDSENEMIDPLKFKDICCRYCHEQFNNLPVFLPTKKKNNIYVKMGRGFSFSFCSFSCANTYNFNLKDGEVNNRQMLLKQYFYEIFKNNIKDINDIIIPQTPPLELLKKLGGCLTIEEWREKASVIGKEYIIQYPSFTSANYFIDEIDNNEKIFSGFFINNNPSGFKQKKN